MTSEKHFWLTPDLYARSARARRMMMRLWQ
jgi:hypothetical protein